MFTEQKQMVPLLPLWEFEINDESLYECLLFRITWNYTNQCSGKSLFLATVSLFKEKWNYWQMWIPLSMSGCWVTCKIGLFFKVCTVYLYFKYSNALIIYG